MVSNQEKRDALEGSLSIELVTFSQRVEEELYYNQNIQSFSHINAIIEVIEIIDEYSLYAFSSISNDNIVIEFKL